MRSLKLKLSLLFFLGAFVQLAHGQAPTAAFEVNDTITCLGTSVSFTDMSTGGVGGIVSWAWNFGDASTSSAQNPSHSYGTGGLKSVTLTVTDAASNTSSISHDVYVIEAIANQSTVRLCFPQSSTTISANAPISSAITGYWFTAGTGLISDPINDTTTISNLISGSYIFYWVLSDGFCSDADQVTVIIDNPVSANAGPDQSVCVTSGTATMAGNNPAPATGQWTTTSTAIIANPANRNTSVSGMTTAGTYTFVWTVTNGACVNRDTMIIVATPVPTANAGIDQTVCASPGTATLSGNTPSSGTVQWTTSSSATIATANAATTGISGLTTAGTYTFIYTVTQSGCIGRDTVAITVSSLVTANAGSDLQVCTSTGTATLNGSNPAPGTGMWSTTSTATITSPNTATTGVTGLNTAGFQYFIWTVTNGGCVSRDTMVAIVRAPSTSNAGSDQSLCGATTTTLAGNTPSPGSGAWTTTSTASITTSSSPTSGVTALPSGNSYFIWTVTYGACVTRDTMMVHVDPLVTSNAGSDQSLCNVTSATMAANSAGTGTGTWTTSSSATITSVNSPTTTITGLTTGTHTFIWTIVNGACTSRDTVLIRVSTPVASNAGIDQSICTSTGTATLSGSSPSPGTGLWTTSSSATINSPSSASSTVSNLNTAGTYTFIWTVTNGACVSRDTVAILVAVAQAANAGPNQSFCDTQTSTNLAGNAASAGTGTWTTSSGATISNINSATSAVTGLTAGTYTFTWTIVNGSCTSTDDVTITVSAEEVADAGVDMQICSTDGMVTLAANTPSAGSGVWFATGAGTITDPTDPNTTVTDLTTAGNYEFIWMISNGTCLSMDTMTVYVDEAVQADAGNDQSLCWQTTTTLHAQGLTTGMGVWISLGSASVVDPLDSLSSVTDLVSGINQFVWFASNGVCLASDTVDVIVYDRDTARAGADQVLCSSTGTTNLSATTPLYGTGLWTTSSSATIVSPASPNSSVTGLNTAGTYNFIWTVTNGACVTTDTVSITVNAVTSANAGSDLQICETTTTLNLAGNTAVFGTGTWTTTSGATITAPNNPSTAVSNLSLGFNTFIWTIVNGPCSSTDTVIVQVDEEEIADAGVDQQLCASAGTTNLSANAAVTGVGVWMTTSSATITDPLDPNTSVSGLTIAGDYEFIWMISSGMCLSTDTVIITIDEDVLADAGADQLYCENAPAVNLNAVAPSSGVGVWIALGAAVADDPLDPNSTVSNLNPGSNQFVWMVSNGLCLNTDTVDILISALVLADAGPDEQICSSPGATILNGSDPTPGTSLWSTTSGALIADPTQAISNISGLNSGGNYEFIYTVTNGGCISTDTVIVAVDDSAIADAGADQLVCETAAVIQLNATAPAIGNGVWVSLGSASVDDMLDPQSTVTGATTGSNQFVWIVSNGVCTSMDTTDIVISTLVVADAGTDQQICASPGITTLAGSDPTPGTSLWTGSSSVIISDSSLASPSVSGMATAGNYDFIYTVTNGGCVSSDTMTIAVDEYVIADAGTDMGLCEDDTIVNLVAQSPSLGTGFWMTTSSATIVDPLDPGTTVTGLVLGPNEFIWTVNNGMCLSSDTVVITLNAIPTTPDAGSDITICSNIDSVVLSGNAPLIGNPQWNSLGSAVVTNIADSIVSVSNLSVGVNVFTYVINNGGCFLCDTMQIIVNAIPTADAGTDQFATANAPVVIGGVIPGSGGLPPYSYNWSPSAQVNDSSLGNPTATATATTSFILTVTDSLGCQGLDTMLLIINDPPVANFDTLTILEDSVININVLANDTDPDNNIDSASVTIVGGPFNGNAITDSTGAVIYTPNANYFGTDSIQYAVCDAGTPVYCDTAWIYINILPVNDAPLANDDNYSTIEDSCITFNVLINDSDVENDIDSTSFAILTNTVHGMITLDTITGQMTYCPDTLYNGNDTLTYVICDNGSPVLCDTAIVVINVSPLDNLPVALNDSIQLCASDSIIVDVLSNDTDAENDSLVISINALPAHGIASLAGNTVVYDPDNTYNGFDSIQYVACEVNNMTMCDTAWVLIAVHGNPVLSATHVNPLCSSDSTGIIDLTVSGNAPYLYNWSTADTTEDVSNLPTGIYTVTVVDSFGCASILTDTIAAPNPLTALSVVQHVNCYGDSSASIDVTVSGGVMPYSFSWSNGEVTEDVDSLPAGIYIVAVADSNGCSVNITDTIIEPASALAVTGSHTNVACASDSTGAIDITVTGGTTPYTYNWSTTAITEDVTSLPAGIYSVTITDSLGCTFIYSDSIISTNPPINISYTSVNAFCIDSVSGSIDVTANGGTGVLTYLWNDNSVTEDLSGLFAGTYTLTVTDSLNCYNIATVTIADSSAISLDLSGTAALCIGDSLNLSVADYLNVSYQWMNGADILYTATTATNAVDSAGAYYVVATSGCGIFVSDTVAVSINALPVVSLIDTASTTCDSAIVLTAAGGISFMWTPSETLNDPTLAAPTASPLESTLYIVAVTDSNGCVATDTITVDVTCITLTIPGGFSPNGDGYNDVFVISKIEDYPDNVLRIFNRWGNMVYEMHDYDNSWNGTSNVSMLMNGNPLPDGTYYYVLDLGNGNEILTGYIVLRR